MGSRLWLVVGDAKSGVIFILYVNNQLYSAHLRSSMTLVGVKMLHNVLERAVRAYEVVVVPHIMGDQVSILSGSPSPTTMLRQQVHGSMSCC